MGLSELISLIATLRSQEGCPWDRAQTAGSISVYLIEELYELLDAISNDNPEEVCEELGDVLFHILFMARVYQEKGAFDIIDVADQVIAKMTRRHPHVFGDVQLDNTDQIKSQWQRIKQDEKCESPFSSILSSVPRALPALMRAYRVSARAAQAGFDWDDLDGVMAKVEEEWREFKLALAVCRDRDQDLGNVRLELGDILFTLVNVARFVSVHPETALSEATNKFEKRFKLMEQKVADQGQKLEDCHKEQLEALWLLAKKEFG